MKTLTLLLTLCATALFAQIPLPPGLDPNTTPVQRPMRTNTTTGATGSTNGSTGLSSGAFRTSPRTNGSDAAVLSPTAPVKPAVTNAIPFPSFPGTASTPATNAAAGSVVAIPSPGSVIPVTNLNTVPPGFTAQIPPGQLQTTAPPSLTPNGNATGVAFVPDPNEVIDSFTIPNMELPQLLDVLYPQITGRTVLRSNQLVPRGPGQAVGTVSLSIQGPMRRKEIIEAIDAVLSMNGITMINYGDRFVKAVPSQLAPTEGAALVERPDQLPLAEQFSTAVVQLKTLKPSEVTAALAGFTKTPQAIIPFENSQTIVIRDYASNIKRILAIIERIDTVVEPDFSLEVIPIKYGKVSDLYDTMQSFISSSGGGSSGQRGAGGRSSSTGRSSSGRSSSSRTSTNPNGTTTPGQPGGVTQPNVAGDRNSLQGRINRIIQNAASQGDMQVLSSDARIVSDERSNSLLVYASKHDMQMITNIVGRLDTQLAQVLIEAIILEVKLVKDNNVGVNIKQNPLTSGQFTGAGVVNNNSSVPFLSQATNLVGGSGLNYFGKMGGSLEAAISAVASDSKIQILSRPHLQLSHATEGNFFIGESVPYITGVNNFGGFGTGNQTQSSYSEKEIGLNLTVTPFITPEGLVVMDIAQDFDSRGADVVIDGNPVPIINKRSVTSLLTVRNTETIILGGFISDNKSNSKSGVPFLKDIPLLGALFRTKDVGSTRSEIIVLIRATILPTPEMAAFVARQERDRLPGIKEAEADFKLEYGDRMHKADKEMDKALKDEKVKQLDDTF